MNANGRFVENEKNYGGRNVIRRQLLEHHNAIVSAKPTIDSRSRPHPHVNANLDTKQKLARGHSAFEFNEVHTAFKKVTNVKGGYIDNKKPVSYDLAKQAIPKNKKKDDFINREHQLHWKSQRKKVEGVGKSIVERKKNIYDPVAHPTILFRRKEQQNKDLTLDFMFSTNAVTAKTATPGFNLTKMRNKLEKRPLTATSQKATQDGYELGSLSPIKFNATELSFIERETVNIPDFDGNPADEGALKKFKVRIIDHIIEKRIYKALDLEMLREQVKVKYPKLDKGKVDKMFDQINADLDA